MYEVTKTSHGRRIKTNMRFKTKCAANKYVRETARYYPGSNPRVVKA